MLKPRKQNWLVVQQTAGRTTSRYSYFVTLKPLNEETFGKLASFRLRITQFRRKQGPEYFLTPLAKDLHICITKRKDCPAFQSNGKKHAHPSLERIGVYRKL